MQACGARRPPSAPRRPTAGRDFATTRWAAGHCQLISTQWLSRGSMHPNLHYLKYKIAELDQVQAWRHVSFSARTSAKGYKAGSRDDGSENGGDTYEGVTCLACGQVHMVSPKTGKVLGR